MFVALFAGRGRPRVQGLHQGAHESEQADQRRGRDEAALDLRHPQGRPHFGKNSHLLLFAQRHGQGASCYEVGQNNSTCKLFKSSFNFENNLKLLLVLKYFLGIIKLLCNSQKCKLLALILFYLVTFAPDGSLMFVFSTTSALEVIVSLLKKFKVVDNPRKFALYERFYENGETAKGRLEISLSLFKPNVRVPKQLIFIPKYRMLFAF